MEEKGTSLITAFDSMFTTNRIQMLKVLLSWLPPAQQGSFAIYIKFLELQYTFTLLRRHPETRLTGSRQLSADFFSGDNTDTIELLDELLPFSSPSERPKIEGMKNMLQSMSKMKEMMEMMEMLKEMFPEGFGCDGDNPMDFFSSMAGMSGMDMSAVFDLFGKEDEKNGQQT